MGLAQNVAQSHVAGTSRIKTSTAKRQGKVRPSWENVKAELARFDRAALLALLQDLYAAASGNRAFLHARFGLGLDLLQPYKKIMDRWLWPDVFRGEEASVSKAKRAISDYRKASGDAEGVAELMVYYCEQAAGFCRDVAYQDAAYLDALVRMFGQALRTTTDLSANSGTIRNRLLERLDRVLDVGHELGYGVGDDMDVLHSGGRPMDIDEEKVDDTVLALLYLTTFADKPRWRTWKSHSWDVLDRLHQKGYISDPATKAKSVLLTNEGAQRSQDLFEKYFAKQQ